MWWIDKTESNLMWRERDWVLRVDENNSIIIDFQTDVIRDLKMSVMNKNVQLTYSILDSGSIELFPEKITLAFHEMGAHEFRNFDRRNIFKIIVCSWVFYMWWVNRHAKYLVNSWIYPSNIMFAPRCCFLTQFSLNPLDFFSSIMTEQSWVWRDESHPSEINRINCESRYFIIGLIYSLFSKEWNLRFVGMFEMWTHNKFACYVVYVFVLKHFSYSVLTGEKSGKVYISR